MTARELPSFPASQLPILSVVLKASAGHVALLAVGKCRQPCHCVVRHPGLSPLSTFPAPAAAPPQDTLKWRKETNVDTGELAGGCAPVACLPACCSPGSTGPPSSQFTVVARRAA